MKCTFYRTEGINTKEWDCIIRSLRTDLHMMEDAHRPEVLLALEETPVASKTVRGWMERGHSVSVITGRPGYTYGDSRRWLDEHGLKEAQLFCLNKYGRDVFYKDSGSNLELEEYYAMKFDIAVEDSPSAFSYFSHLPDLKVMVFDRPWNTDCVFPGPGYTRCAGWDEIDREFRRYELSD